MTGQLLALLVVASPWLLLVVPAAAVGAAAAWVVQQLRRGGVRHRRRAMVFLAGRCARAETEGDRLRGRLVDAHLARRAAEEQAAAYWHKADSADARAAALSADVHELRLALGRATGGQLNLRAWRRTTP